MKRPAYFKGGSLDGKGVDVEKAVSRHVVPVPGGEEIYVRTNRKMKVTMGKMSTVADLFRFEKLYPTKKSEKTGKPV